MFAKPEIGSYIKVVTDWSDFYHSGFADHVRATNKHHTIIGEVLPSNDFDDPASFCITTGNPNHPEAVIDLKRVVELSHADGLEADANAMQDEEIKSQTWTVEGSKGKVYTVTRNGEQWSCTCPGFGFRRQCKHVNSKKAEVLGI